ncbi:MAG: hypothetical protein E7531_01270 [Ruminococcaceae bacterium]|nr:hypothetical protein [Oscillospiraceae bacterium]
MKQIKVSLCILCTAFMLLCCSCGLFGDQEYACVIDHVESIEIVRLEEYVQEEYRYEYTVLSKITDCTTFVDRLNNIKHSVNWGEPSQFDIGYVVIKIEYLNGDYELLYTNAQMFNRSGVNQYGYFFFDDEQFNSLISDYI